MQLQTLCMSIRTSINFLISHVTLFLRHNLNTRNSASQIITFCVKKSYLDFRAIVYENTKNEMIRIVNERN